MYASPEDAPRKDRIKMWPTSDATGGMEYFPLLCPFLMFNIKICSLKFLSYYNHLCKSSIFQMMFWCSFYFIVIKTFLVT